MVDIAQGQQIAQFIDHARRRHPKLSVRAAADRAGISEGWWRQLVAGYQRRAEAEVPVVGSPDTYLSMARVVGVVAEVRNMLGDEAPEELPAEDETRFDVITETTEAIRNDPSLNEVGRAHLLRQYAILREWSEASRSTDHEQPESPAASSRPLRAVARKRPSPRRDQL